jgi:hypothetical protein
MVHALLLVGQVSVRWPGAFAVATKRNEPLVDSTQLTWIDRFPDARETDDGGAGDDSGDVRAEMGELAASGMATSAIADAVEPIARRVNLVILISRLPLELLLIDMPRAPLPKPGMHPSP